MRRGNGVRPRPPACTAVQCSGAWPPAGSGSACLKDAELALQLSQLRLHVIRALRDARHGAKARVAMASVRQFLVLHRRVTRGTANERVHRRRSCRALRRTLVPSAGRWSNTSRRMRKCHGVRRCRATPPGGGAARGKRSPTHLDSRLARLARRAARSAAHCLLLLFTLTTSAGWPAPAACARPRPRSRPGA
jgi:hypothetical protein